MQLSVHKLQDFPRLAEDLRKLPDKEGTLRCISREELLTWQLCTLCLVQHILLLAERALLGDYQCRIESIKTQYFTANRSVVQ